MSVLAKTVSKVRSGVFHIVFLDASKRRVSSGTAFASRGYFVTNGHVFDTPPGAMFVWIRQDQDQDLSRGVLISARDFESRRVVASPQDEYDYAVLDIPELSVYNPHQFDIIEHDSCNVGDPVALLGYPFEGSVRIFVCEACAVSPTIGQGTVSDG
jgi:hypothetical protein